MAHKIYLPLLTFAALIAPAQTWTARPLKPPSSDYHLSDLRDINNNGVVLLLGRAAPGFVTPFKTIDVLATPTEGRRMSLPSGASPWGPITSGETGTQLIASTSGGVNDLGQMVGTAPDSTGRTLPYRSGLGAFGSWIIPNVLVQAFAGNINNAGTIVYHYPVAASPQAYKRTIGGAESPMCLPAIVAKPAFSRINDANVAALNTTSGPNPDAIYIERPGMAPCYKTVPKLPSPYNLGIVMRDFNNAGHVAGFGAKSNYASGQKAFYYDGTTTHAVPMLANWTESQLNALNNKGDAIGTGFTSSGQVHFLWRLNTQPLTLNNRISNGWTLTYVHAVNDHLQIAGLAIPPGGVTAVPVRLDPDFAY